MGNMRNTRNLSLFNNLNNMSSDEVFEIGANCLLVLKNRFFAVVEIESEVPGVDLEVFVIIRIDEQTAMQLHDAGLEFCEIVNRIPEATEGVNVEFKCIFINKNQAFALFDVEDDFDEAVFVRISLDEAKRLIRRGAMQCTVIDARNNNSNC
ncbi:hypothetical protein QUF84_22020 [Fictibacillus enclensis]|uniref:hypothetical protein n=2 Tax=Fictibacillus enclensis TaxID=1017270 RepID=UPI0025A0673B|nr:hypothetical protein [Fictibacillus enclensis]MDM5200514.1 hypothetical protein [Fictibacillus enclensis]MDM5339877.1 hypothetical protein [Fictibacillus enclensis]